MPAWWLWTPAPESAQPLLPAPDRNKRGGLATRARGWMLGGLPLGPQKTGKPLPSLMLMKGLPPEATQNALGMEHKSITAVSPVVFLLPFSMLV